MDKTKPKEEGYTSRTLNLCETCKSQEESGCLRCGITESRGVKKGKTVSNMRYIFEGGHPDRVMHIQKFTVSGEPLMRSLCGIDLNFNRTCNLPLGQKVCINCRKKL